MSVKYHVSDYVVHCMEKFDLYNKEVTQWDRFFHMLMKLGEARNFKVLSTQTKINLHVELKIQVKTYDCKMVHGYTVYPPIIGNWFEETILSLEWCDQECNRKIAELIEKIYAEENTNV